jgi:hypothetical protein
MFYMDSRFLSLSLSLSLFRTHLAARVFLLSFLSLSLSR